MLRLKLLLVDDAQVWVLTLDWKTRRDGVEEANEVLLVAAYAKTHLPFFVRNGVQGVSRWNGHVKHKLRHIDEGPVLEDVCTPGNQVFE